MVSQENIFINRPTRNKKCLSWPCLISDLNENNNIDRVPSIDTSYQVSVIWPKSFRREYFWKSNNQKQMFAYGGHVCKWIETKLSIFIEAIPRCFRRSFDLIVQVVSGENFYNQP